ncbi:MAG: lysoplasmalogenase [Comamonadaceae bacterium]|nr:lysoplasmalogenase [Comamonadaceae bacterium]
MLVAMIVIAVLVTALFVVFEVRHRHLDAFFVKGFASFCFILLAVGSMLYQNATRGEHAFSTNPLLISLILPGLVLGLMGDLFLATRTLRPKEENEKIILGGTITFALGHLFYLSALFLIAGFNVRVFVAAVLLSAAIYGAAIVMKMNWGKLKVPCMAHSFLLFLFAAQSVFLWSSSGEAWTATLALGGILFAVSDLVLSQIYFMNNGERPVRLAEPCDLLCGPDPDRALPRFMA